MIDLEADYSALIQAQENGIVVQLHDPITFEPTVATVTMAGPDTKIARVAKIRAMRKALKATLAVDGAPEMDDVEADLIYQREYLAGKVISWTNIGASGKLLEPTFENAVTFFERFPWWQTECDEKSARRVGFIPS